MLQALHCNMEAVIHVLLFVVAIAAAVVYAADQCRVTDQCSCQFDDGRKISLRPIDNKGGSVRFRISSQESIFQYNPCTPFTAESPAGQCVNVLICQSGLIGAQPLALAYPNSTLSSYDNGNGMYKFMYTGGSVGYSKKKFKSVVRLKCDMNAKDPSITTFVEKPLNTFTATLTTKYACPSSVLSTGSILCIVFFSLVLAYLVFGILISKFVLHKEGSDVLPHKSFWLRVPSLIKDGAIFTYRKIRGKGGQYEQL